MVEMVYRWLEPQLEKAEKELIFEHLAEVDALTKELFWARNRLSIRLKIARDKRWSELGCKQRCTAKGCTALVCYKAYDANMFLCDHHFKETSDA